MIQYFRFFIVATLLSLGIGSVMSAETDNTLSTTFNRLVGVDLFGDDLTSKGFKGISLSECEDICLNDNSCRAYSFIEDKQWCFPKHGSGNQQENSNVTSGVRVGENTNTVRSQFNVVPLHVSNFDCSHSFEKNAAEEAYCKFMDLNPSLSTPLMSSENFYEYKKLSFKVGVLGEFSGYTFLIFGSDDDFKDHDYSFSDSSPLIAIDCDTKQLSYLSNAKISGSYNGPTFNNISFDRYLALLSKHCLVEEIDKSDFEKFNSFCYSQYYDLTNALIAYCELRTMAAYYNLIERVIELISDKVVDPYQIGTTLKVALKNWILYSEAQCALDRILVGSPAALFCRSSMAAEYYSKTIDLLTMDFLNYAYQSELKALNIKQN